MTGIGIGLSDFKATRPRRFGKNLNMTTLRYYFDNRVTDVKELFQNLKSCN